jgi:hypothetical protein
MRLGDFAFAAIITLSLFGCTAHTASSDAPKAPATEPAVSQPAAPAPAAASPPPEQDVQAPIAPRRETAEEQGLIESRTGLVASDPSRSCKADSDCAVKDVGNCCGYFPMCVNKDARTDPAAVRAQCEKDGMASICGFREVSGCQCVKGQCESLTDGSVLK